MRYNTTFARPSNQEHNQEYNQVFNQAINQDTQTTYLRSLTA